MIASVGIIYAGSGITDAEARYRWHGLASLISGEGKDYEMDGQSLQARQYVLTIRRRV
jgi:hypothetical protein